MKTRVVYAWEYWSISYHNGDSYGEEIVYSDNPEKEPQRTQYLQWHDIKRRPEKDMSSRKELKTLNRGLVK
jgi:hypothetical protein